MDLGTALTWLGIGLCVLQSGSFSGLNLALFGVSALRLQAQAAVGDEAAARLLELRRDSNFLLTTVLWGNVSTNVLLALLSDSVMTGVVGFFFSTFVITFGGEILPQAYFSRNALRMATHMRPFLRLWQTLLYPIAKPTALMLDAWLGRESVDFLDELTFSAALRHYVAAPTSEIGRVEGIGALNFLRLDDLAAEEEGEELDPESVVPLPVEGGALALPDVAQSRHDPFLRRVAASGRKWAVLTTPEGDPRLVLDVDGLCRAALFDEAPPQVSAFCHAPVVVRNPRTALDRVLPELRVDREREGDDVIDRDVILVWAEVRRIITGSDLLGRLLRGIARPA